VEEGVDQLLMRHSASIVSLAASMSPRSGSGTRGRG
jgi:hypothetical protein